MIDPRFVTFDASKIEGITLIQDNYMGTGLVTLLSGSTIIASLASNTLFEAIFFKPDEGPGPRFYVPNCNLLFDPFAVADHKQDPPPGSLIVAERSVSVMVKPPRGAPTPLCLAGEPPAHAFEGICITDWQLESPEGYGDPRRLLGVKAGAVVLGNCCV